MMMSGVECFVDAPHNCGHRLVIWLSAVCVSVREEAFSIAKAITALRTHEMDV